MDAMKTLVRDRWMMAVRGVLAGAFGLTLLAWPEITLVTVLVLFATYVFVDGVWTIVAATVARDRRWEAWPVALEGLVGAVVGVVALGWPLSVPGEIVFVIVAWSVVTGLLEIVAATRMPRTSARHWLFATGGLTSLSLAILLLVLPHADIELVARLLGGYALVFGSLMILATVRLPRGRRRAAGAHGRV
jgi:uncharacterized membrane protein HdeD (DUF308 family)